MIILLKIKINKNNEIKIFFFINCLSKEEKIHSYRSTGLLLVFLASIPTIIISF